ncbi:MAG: tyrosine-type recombinase/integrase [Rhodothermales bacterium]|nr:tyrosine-type recombinase/integrase [Rhodothermales bacterium]MBO6778547.1 tyrosine-type recombinase/integrase [Rhodothermales bacterium]
MPASIKAIIRKDRLRADGTCPIYIRVTVNRKTSKYAVGIAVRTTEWNERRARVRSSHDLADAYNRKIEQMLNEARERGLDAPTARAVVRAAKIGSGLLLDDLDAFRDVLGGQGKVWELKHFGVLRNKVERCFGKLVAWRDLDAASLVRFESFLREIDGNSNNTVRNHLKRLRRLHRRQVARGLLSSDTDPFRGYQRPSAEPVQKRRLKREEIAAIESLSLGEGGALAISRDAFLFSFYASGVRFGDLCMLKPENMVDGRLHYRMMKTGQPVSVKLPEQALVISTRYPLAGFPCLFPYLRSGDLRDLPTAKRRISSRNVIANRNIKKVAEAAGVQSGGLTMHVARHSFADHARVSGGDLYAISKALGHSNIQITQSYLSSFDQDAVDALVESIF